MVRLLTEQDLTEAEFSAALDVFGRIPHRDKIEVLGQMAELFENQIVLGSSDPQQSGQEKARIFEAILKRFPALEDGGLRKLTYPLKPKPLASLSKGTPNQPGMYELAMQVMPRNMMATHVESSEEMGPLNRHLKCTNLKPI